MNNGGKRISWVQRLPTFFHKICQYLGEQGYDADK